MASDPRGARFRTQIISAAHESFIGGLHLASVVAAVIVLVAVAGVLIWLPAMSATTRVEPTMPAACVERNPLALARSATTS